MNDLAALLDLTEDVLWLHFIVFLRVAAAISLFPGFGEQSVPIRIKLGLAIMMTMITAPAISPALLPFAADPPPIGLIVLTEAIVGLLIGLGIRLFVMALQTAGTIAAQSTSLSQILGVQGIEPIPAMGHMLVLGGITLAMILGLHIRLAELIILTYTLFPAAEFPDPSAVSSWGIRQVANAFALAFALAAPFVIVSVLYNLTLGIINRAMPQMMVVFVGAPVIVGGGIVILLVMAPTILALWADALGGFMANPFGGR
ncbi:MAG: flagellar biosynthetic protein FliR [Pseudomonadota bacterium]